MSERIKKTPIKETLASLETAWDDANQRLKGMSTDEVLEKRMPGAVYFNSSHPFRDKLHVEGMMEGLKFVLTGESPAVEYWIKRAAAIKSGEVEASTQQVLKPSSKVQVAVRGLLQGLSLGEAWGILRAKPVPEGELYGKK